MYIAVRIIPLVCLYIHKCHMPINPYFLCAPKDFAQRLLFVFQQDTSSFTRTTVEQGIYRHSLERHNICHIVHYCCDQMHTNRVYAY